MEANEASQTKNTVNPQISTRPGRFQTKIKVHDSRTCGSSAQIKRLFRYDWLNIENGTYLERAPKFGISQWSLFLVLIKKIKVSEDRRECSVIHTQSTVEQATEKTQQKNISVVASTG